MKSSTRFYVSPAAFSAILMSLVWSNAAHAFDDGYGSITGQFVLEGDIPEPKLLVRKGDPKAKDPTVCAAQNVFSDSFLVDPKTKGIQHIFIYRRKAKRIHPDLKASKNKEVVLDQQGCMFTPHTLLLRTDQTLVIKSGDACPHNTHTLPIRNQSQNFVLAPNDRIGARLKYPIPEFQPVPIKCDIHSWMKAYGLVLDHPYAAITDKQGRFTISNLPAGEHEFRVWHERIGYFKGGFQGAGISKYKRGFKVTVTKGATTKIGPLNVPVERFERQ